MSLSHQRDTTSNHSRTEKQKQLNASYLKRQKYQENMIDTTSAVLAAMWVQYDRLAQCKIKIRHKK